MVTTTWEPAFRLRLWKPARRLIVAACLVGHLCAFVDLHRVGFRKLLTRFRKGHPRPRHVTVIVAPNGAWLTTSERIFVYFDPHRKAHCIVAFTVPRTFAGSTRTVTGWGAADADAVKLPSPP